MALSAPLSLRDQVKLSVGAVLAAFPIGIPLHDFLREYRDLEGKHLPVRDLGYNSPADLLTSFTDVVRVIGTSTGQKVLQGIPNENSAHIYKFVQQQNTKTNKSARRVKELLRNGNSSQEVTNKSRETRPMFGNRKAEPRHETAPLNPKDVEQKIHSLLQCYPSGLPFSALGPLFRERYNQNLHVSLEQLVSMASTMETLNIRKVKEQTGTVYKVFRVKAKTMETSPTREQGIPDDVKLKVRKAVGSCKDGVALHEFYKAYNTTNNESLNVQFMGFPCLMEFLETLDQEVVRLDRSQPGSVRILPLRPLTESQTLKSSAPSSSSSKELGCRSLGNSGKIPREELPRAALEGKSFSIKVGWVSHPENFWWTLEESTDAIISLEYSMMNFYESPANQNSVLLTNEITIGQLVAAKSPMTFCWQRAVVVSYAIEGKYAVRFVDHGDWQKVALSHLRPLNPEFTHLPLQAKKSRLHGVHSPDAGWPDQISQRFKALLCYGLIEARCVAIEDGQEPCYVLELMRNNKSIAKELLSEDDNAVQDRTTESVKKLDISGGLRIQVIRLADGKPHVVSEELAALTRHKTLEALKNQLKDQYASQVLVWRRGEEEVELLPVKTGLQVLAFHGCSYPAVISHLKGEMK